MKQFKDLKIGDILYWAYSDGDSIEIAKVTNIKLAGNSYKVETDNEKINFKPVTLYSSLASIEKSEESYIYISPDCSTLVSTVLGAYDSFIRELERRRHKFIINTIKSLHNETDYRN